MEAYSAAAELGPAEADGALVAPVLGGVVSAGELGAGEVDRAFGELGLVEAATFAPENSAREKKSTTPFWNLARLKLTWPFLNLAS